ncbi:MAG: hypothetical protein ACRENE_23560, partial [Polyangiaceae bacterium]
MGGPGRERATSLPSTHALLVAVLGAGGAVLLGCAGAAGGSDGGSAAAHDAGADARDGGAEACARSSCPSLYGQAIFEMSCARTDLVEVTVGGVCAPDAGSYYDVGNQDVSINAFQAGVCPVSLRFASGFTYSTEVAFTASAQVPDCCRGPSIAPAQVRLMVPNPSSTCIDGGIDDAGGDAVSPPLCGSWGDCTSYCSSQNGG